MRSAPRWLRPIRIGRFSAIALPWAIYVTPSGLAGPLRDLAPLIVHELVHIEQWRELGRFRFPFRYVGAYVLARSRGQDAAAAYRDLGFERAARSIQASLFPAD